MEKTDEAKTLDCSNAGRGVWLVKLPKYIAKKWLKGKIFIESWNVYVAPTFILACHRYAF